MMNVLGWFGLSSFKANSDKLQFVVLGQCVQNSGALWVSKIKIELTPIIELLRITMEKTQLYWSHKNVAQRANSESLVKLRTHNQTVSDDSFIESEFFYFLNIWMSYDSQ